MHLKIKQTAEIIPLGFFLSIIYSNLLIMYIFFVHSLAFAQTYNLLNIDFHKYSEIYDNKVYLTVLY